jgi:Sap-like sulfolipid-1-addressing protein
VHGALPYAFFAAANPTLLGATTVMLLLDHPKRLLLGYLLGALMTSITLGLVIVFALDGSAKTAQHTLSPAYDLAIGALLIALSYGISRWDQSSLAERRRQRKASKPDKGPPFWQRKLSSGSAWMTFVIGAALTLPGASYLIGLHKISEGNPSTVRVVASVLIFNVIMLALLEVPLIGFTFAPEWTRDAIDRFKAWFAQNARQLGSRIALILGGLLILRGLFYIT